MLRRYCRYIHETVTFHWHNDATITHRAQWTNLTNADFGMIDRDSDAHWPMLLKNSILRQYPTDGSSSKTSTIRRRKDEPEPKGT